MRTRVERSRWLPRLGWVADLGESVARIVCGSHVEVGDGWVAEALWDGRFDAGGFDRTEAVFGSGVRVRKDGVRLIPSAGLVDRLWVHRTAGWTGASNSLPALLAVSGDRLHDDVGYRELARNLPAPEGRLEPDRFLSTREGSVAVVYRRNVVWDGEELWVIRKPASEEDFSDFASYRDHLFGVAMRMGANASAGAREHPVSLLTTVSRGYDSPAVSILARRAGCRRAVTIRQARSVVPRNDSGEEIASELGLSCEMVERAGRGGPDELAFWAADGRAEDQNLAAFDYPGEVTSLFSGAYGGVIWDDDEHKHPALAEFADPNMLSFCEFRLLRGVIHCPLPYLGYEQAEEILGITRSPEMKPWTLGGDYDRPIPRRIVEEAGVPRGMFGQRKNATQFEETFHWPYRTDLQRSYADYLRGLGREVPAVGWYRFLNFLDRNLLLPLEERSPLRFSGLRARLRRPQRWLLNWANNEMTDRLVLRQVDDTFAADAGAA